MPSFRISPFPAMVDPNLKVVEAAIPPALVAHIRMLGDEAIDQRGGEPGRVGYNEDSAVRLDSRNAETQWLLFPWDDPRTAPVYEGLSEVVQQTNSLHWQYNITDYYDMFHYIRYHGPADHGRDCLCGGGEPKDYVPGHFDWHRDSGDEWRRPQRKLSFTLVLSTPDEYVGGEFQFFDGAEIQVATCQPGDLIVFPSYLQHRVTPVTMGLRRSLVGWASGPKLQ